MREVKIGETTFDIDGPSDPTLGLERLSRVRNLWGGYDLDPDNGYLPKLPEPDWFWSIVSYGENDVYFRVEIRKMISPKRGWRKRAQSATSEVVDYTMMDKLDWSYLVLIEKTTYVLFKIRKGHP